MDFVTCLKNDGVIAYPTDTVYGLCCRFDSIKAMEHLREIKNRHLEKSFPIMVANVEQLEKIAYVNEDILKLVDRFMPGPITLILKKKDIIEPWMNDNRDTVAIRMACDEKLKSIINDLGVPVFMTSANKSGEKVCISSDEIKEKLSVDMIYVGKPKGELASSIVDCTNNYRIIRLGVITQDMIDETIKK